MRTINNKYLSVLFRSCFGIGLRQEYDRSEPVCEQDMFVVHRNRWKNFQLHFIKEDAVVLSCGLC